jgi:hypothetical protein
MIVPADMSVSSKLPRADTAHPRVEIEGYVIESGAGTALEIWPLSFGIARTRAPDTDLRIHTSEKYLDIPRACLSTESSQPLTRSDQLCSNFREDFHRGCLYFLPQSREPCSVTWVRQVLLKGIQIDPFLQDNEFVLVDCFLTRESALHVNRKAVLDAPDFR